MLNLQQYTEKFPLPKDTPLTSQRGNLIPSQKIQDIFKGLFQNEELDDCSSYSVRRWLRTYASNAGIEIRTIQSIARHHHLGTIACYI